MEKLSLGRKSRFLSARVMFPLLKENEKINPQIMGINSKRANIAI